MSLLTACLLNEMSLILDVMIYTISGSLNVVYIKFFFRCAAFDVVNIFS